jgi:hypothetical protein
MCTANVAYLPPALHLGICIFETLRLASWEVEALFLTGQDNLGPSLSSWPVQL